MTRPNTKRIRCHSTVWKLKILREINFWSYVGKNYPFDIFRGSQFWSYGICPIFYNQYQNLISRKNQVAGNFFNFHTVQLVVQACPDAYFKNTFDGFACQKNPSIEAAWNLCDLWFEWQIFMECCLVRMQQTSREWSLLQQRSSRGHGNYFEIETLDITSNTPQHKKRRTQPDASIHTHCGNF